jgi:hypothetical protein
MYRDPRSAIQQSGRKKLQSQQIQVHAETAKARQGKLPLFGIGKEEIDGWNFYVKTESHSSRPIDKERSKKQVDNLVVHHVNTSQGAKEEKKKRDRQLCWLF